MKTFVKFLHSFDKPDATKRKWVLPFALFALALCVWGIIGDVRQTSVNAGPARVDEHALMIQRAVGHPVLDGNITEWLGLPSIPLNADLASYIEGSTPTAADCSAVLRLAWDAQNLYVVISVTDDIVHTDNQPQLWFEDGIELGIDGNNDQAGGGYSDHQYALLSDGRRGDYGFSTMRIQYAAKVVPGGWTGEAMIPLSSLQLDNWTVGRAFGFTWAVNDDDHQILMGLSSRLLWAGEDTNPPTADWGQVTLGSDAFVIGGPTPTPGTPSPTPTLAPTPDPNDPCQRYEPNNTVTTAYGPLANGLTYSAAICGGDFPNDFYKIDVPAGSYVRTLVTDILDNADLDLYLYNSTFQIVARSTGIGPQEFAAFLARIGGTYYVRLYAYRPAAVASYRLTVTWSAGHERYIPSLGGLLATSTPTPTVHPGGETVTPTPTRTPIANICQLDEPNDGADQATPIQIGTVYYRAVCPDDLRDAYKFNEISSSGKTFVSLCEIPAGTNYDIWLFDANKNKRGAETFEVNGCKTIAKDLDPGLYYVVVGPEKEVPIPNGRSTRPYRLQVTE